MHGVGRLSIVAVAVFSLALPSTAYTQRYEEAIAKADLSENERQAARKLVSLGAGVTERDGELNVHRITR